MEQNIAVCLSRNYTVGNHLNLIETWLYISSILFIITANLGGTLGLCIGASMLTVCEFIEHGIVSLVYCYKRCKYNQSKTHVIPEPSHFQKSPRTKFGFTSGVWLCFSMNSCSLHTVISTNRLYLNVCGHNLRIYEMWWDWIVSLTHTELLIIFILTLESWARIYVCILYFYFPSWFLLPLTSRHTDSIHI
mgnify:CR=1 FL=1